MQNETIFSIQHFVPAYAMHRDRLTDLRCSVEPADQVGCDVVLSYVGRGTKVTELQYGLRLIHLVEDNEQ